LHYYQFNIGDYSSHTSRLSIIEDLTYRRLLDLYYLTERPFNGCSTDVARDIGLQDYQKEVDYILGKFFPKDGDFWVNNRCKSEVEAYQSKKVKASKAGKASAEARKTKASKQAFNDRSTTVQQESNDRSTKHKPITKNQEPITSKQDKPKDLSPKGDERVDQVFNYWCSVFNKTASSKLTPKRKKAITDRLKEGYTLEEIKLSIDGCSQSEYHMGKNDTGAIYNDLELICRSGEKVEQFASNYNGIIPQAQKYSKTTEQNIINAQGFINGE